MVQLTVGSHRDNATTDVLLTAEKFNRHTFWCGQSGSGKVSAVAVLGIDLRHPGPPLAPVAQVGANQEEAPRHRNQREQEPLHCVGQVWALTKLRGAHRGQRRRLGRL